MVSYIFRCIWRIPRHATVDSVTGEVKKGRQRWHNAQRFLHQASTPGFIAREQDLESPKAVDQAFASRASRLKGYVLSESLVDENLPGS